LEIEARAKMPGATGERRGGAKDREHRKHFERWLRSPHDTSARQTLGDLQHNAGIEAKDVTIGTPASGGFAVPEESAREIERLELAMSPIRDLVRVATVGTSDFKHLVSTRGAGFGWAGEVALRTGIATSQLRERAPTHGELYAYPTASNWSLDDVFFNVGDWLAEEAAEGFAIAEADAVIRGDGSDKPTGMLHAAPAPTGDFASPLRNAGAYQFIASVSKQSPAVAEIVPDQLIDLVYSVNARYRAGASWVMNSMTPAAISKLKDSEGRYLWRASMVERQPDRLLGYPVRIVEAMDDIGTNAFPVAFGNFAPAHLLVDRTGLAITVDPYTAAGFTKFYVRRRVGGCVLSNDAAKVLKATLV
jgi:HK97 family phage major capsid protein